MQPLQLVRALIQSKIPHLESLWKYELALKREPPIEESVWKCVLAV